MGGGFVPQKKPAPQKQPNEDLPEPEYTGVAKEMNDLFNIAVVKKEPHIVLTVPNAQTNDTATWQPKIKPRKTPQL